MAWLGGAIVILVLALVLQLGLVSYIMYALLGVILVSRWLTKQWAEGITAEREMNRTEVTVGDQVAVVATLSNMSKIPIAWGLWEDLLPRTALIFRPPNLQVTGRRVLLSSIKPGETKRILYQLKCHRRGYYQIGPLVMETGDLFGLHRRFRILSKPTFLTVLPQVIPLEGYDIASRRPLGEVRMTYRLFEDPTRNAGVREYQAGDPLNRVHWGATARTGVMHSKIYEPSTVAGATFVIDFHTKSNPRQNEPMRSELAITATASLAQALYELGQEFGMVSNGRDAADRVRQEGWAYDLRTRDAARQSVSMSVSSTRLRPQILTPQRGPEQLHQLLRCLARMELTDGLEFFQLLNESACRIPRNTTVIAVLQRVEESHAIALGNLRRQGYAVTALLNVHEPSEFADNSRPLLIEGISTRHLASFESVSTIARQQFFGVY